ncbi:hypothetical protein D0C36_19405 [Mucilaginibacter conchicola]|uniref:ATPase dynein-related AAA domain-containing protein n=1 Tax=Mucilaginibacter conchicola TaxID=2303333 RepID=A0A372NQ97_9SPHI|nr:AAA family ATPase [Mucilaginibacter conchicola]RFZ91111.1 hypothetical protein D0C36_19405 [Mucilaginibacter conchicola]
MPLKDIPALAADNKKRLQSIDIWPETGISENFKAELLANEALRVVQINSGSVIIKTGAKADSNRVSIALEYFYIFTESFDFLKEVKEYVPYYTRIKEMPGFMQRILDSTKFLEENPGGAGLSSQDFYREIKAFTGFTDSDLQLVLPLLSYKKYSKTKQLVNKEDGKLTARSEDDFFGSLILTGINIPAASSSAIGNLYYDLLKYPELLSAVSEPGSVFIKAPADEKAEINDDILIPQTGLENVIWYGPPGTGKTRLLGQYLNGRTEAQKEFVTFHQSYSYEEFVEGIKPRIDNSGEKVVDNSAILNSFADRTFRYLIRTFGYNRVMENTTESAGRHGDENYTKIRFPFFGTGPLIGIFSEPKTTTELSTSGIARFFEEDLELPGRPNSYFTTQWGDTEADGRTFRSLVRFTEHVSEGSLTAIKEGNEYLLIQRLSKSASLSYEYADGVFITACRKASALAGYASLEDCLADTPDNRRASFSAAVSEGRTFVFCIDEINRANISAVFGELITLIERDKRLGYSSELMVRLPYSKRMFGIPANLILIGTMNTADRSVTLLDTALRRRFTFREMPPSPQSLGDITIEGVNLSDLLTTINRRITYFLGKDLCIGHAYFHSAANGTGVLDNLQLLDIFRNNIIPLLEEYFYNDYYKIQLVLGDNNKTVQEHPFYIQDAAGDAAELFSGGLNEITDDSPRLTGNPAVSALSSAVNIPVVLFTRIYGA